MIQVRNLCKSFGRQQVLRDVSFDVQPGSTTAVVGPSGVGKSVLLKIVMGIMKPERGSVFLDDVEITHLDSELEKNQIRESMGVLFQSAALLDSMTLYDNIAFPLVQCGNVSAAEVHERVCFMIEKLSLENFAFRNPQAVSLGIRKRAGMARALIREPKLFLLDEPNTGLDPLVGQEVYDLISFCKKEWKFTGLLISHELPEVFQVSDEVIMLLNGELVLQGSPQEFLESDNEAVQQFLHGSVNGPIRIQ
ncbi:MAG: ATP-binding cassette domain-containing protein [Bdellovibrionales bacterium]|nr:ATP-binding cassette domain-containing protein [Bdellovibrionales bacterium]